LVGGDDDEALFAFFHLSDGCVETGIDLALSDFEVEQLGLLSPIRLARFGRADERFAVDDDGLLIAP